MTQGHQANIGCEPAALKRADPGSVPVPASFRTSRSEGYAAEATETWGAVARTNGTSRGHLDPTGPGYPLIFGKPRYGGGVHDMITLCPSPPVTWTNRVTAGNRTHTR